MEQNTKDYELNKSQELCNQISAYLNKIKDEINNIQTQEDIRAAKIILKKILDIVEGQYEFLKDHHTAEIIGFGELPQEEY